MLVMSSGFLEPCLAESAGNIVVVIGIHRMERTVTLLSAI